MSIRFELASRTLDAIEADLVDLAGTMNSGLRPNAQFVYEKRLWVQGQRGHALQIADESYGDPERNREIRRRAHEVASRADALVRAMNRFVHHWAESEERARVPGSTSQSALQPRDATADKAAQRLARRARLVPRRRRALVVETQRDLMLAEGGALEIERRRKFELQDLYLDALRSRTGAPPGASIAPFLLGMAMLVGAGAVLGLDIHLHLELKTVLLIQLATAPFLALVLLAMIAAAATFVLRKYRVR